MKNKGFSIGIFFLMLLLCTTCTKEETLLTPDGEPSALKSVSVENAVITVAPVAGDDTNNIRAAFEAAKDVGPGTIVFLTEGVFQVSEVIEVVDFNGTFRGAGQGNTIIEIGSIGGTFNSPFQFILGEMSSLELMVTELSIRFTAPYSGVGIYIPGNFTGGSTVLSGQININNINIEGGSGIRIASVENVEAVIEGCNFSNVFEGVSLGMMEDSKVIVRDNHFTNYKRGIPIWQLWIGGSSFCVERNTLEFDSESEDPFPSIYAVYCYDYVEPNNYLLQHNHIVSKQIDKDYWWEEGQIVIENYTTSHTEIRSNNFNLVESYLFSGISVWGSEDLLISNNKFAGEAGTAINTHVWGTNTINNMVILGDNINQLNTNSNFPIQLRENTSYCTVVGNAKDNVLDLGTNNILTGVTRHTGPSPGTFVSDAMSDKIQKIFAQYNINP